LEIAEEEEVRINNHKGTKAQRKREEARGLTIDN
jgi:hypothetical protein